MTWPFVRRARYEQLEHNFNELRRLARSLEREASRAQYDKLMALYEKQLEQQREVLANYFALRQAGLQADQAMPAAQQLVKPDPDLPPIVADAVTESTRGLSREVRNATRAKAKAMLAAGGKPEDVADQVRRGEKLA